MKVVLQREDIENRALGMWDAFAVEDENAAMVNADPQQRLAVLHGIRFGAMAAIEAIHIAEESP